MMTRQLLFRFDFDFFFLLVMVFELVVRIRKILRRRWRRKQGGAIGLCSGLIVIGKVRTLRLKSWMFVEL